MTQKNFNVVSWLTITVAVAITVVAWGADVNWKLGSLTPYQWFPLFGLLAWVVMATHYYLGSVRILNPGLKRPRFYRRATGYLVLGSLLLHPMILATAQKNNGQGTPPQSFIDYVGDDMRLAVFLGTFSLLLFLSFELLEKLKRFSFVSRAWLAVSIAQIVAMTFIWVHALRLGDVVTEGWFSILWIVMAIALLPCFYIVLKADIDDRKSTS